VERRRARLEKTGARLRALSPRATLERGYAIVRGQDGIVRSSGALAGGDQVDVELAEGGFTGTVDETR
jgi:exodeoxyribonuclease VII large subunit